MGRQSGYDARHERELRELHERLTAQALDRQTAEYARRLVELNGEQSRVQAILAGTVPRELFDSYRAERARALEAALAVVEERRERLARDAEARYATLEQVLNIERHARIRTEGALAALRVLLVFLGLPGIVAFAFGVWSVFGPK